MPKDQNITLEYGGVRFEEPLLYFLEQCLRAGLPPMQQQSINLIQDFMANLAKNKELTVSYNAKRTTYGTAQHLNVYEEFIVNYGGVPKFKVYLEYANDPHHRIDASRRHVPREDIECDTFEYAIITTPIHDVLKKLLIYSDEYTTIEGYGTGGAFWFKHDLGKSVIGIEMNLKG